MASFFSDLGKTFQSAAKTIQKKTAEGMEATRRNSELRSLREEQKKLFATLGETYYASHGEGEAREQLDLLVRRIDELAERIEAVTAEIDALNAKKRCPGCGAVVNIDAKFCPSCGAKMPEAKRKSRRMRRKRRGPSTAPAAARSGRATRASAPCAASPLAPRRQRAKTRPSRKWRSTGRKRVRKSPPPKNRRRATKNSRKRREKTPALAGLSTPAALFLGGYTYPSTRLIGRRSTVFNFSGATRRGSPR